MKNRNIDFLMEMIKSYLDGKLDSSTYSLDFPYEVQTRYKKPLTEDRKLAEIIYDCLVEDGVNLYDDLTEEKLKRKISKEYVYDVYQGNIDII